MGKKRDNAKRIALRIASCKRRLFEDKVIDNPVTHEVYSREYCLTNKLADLESRSSLTMKQVKEKISVESAIAYEKHMLSIWECPVKGPLMLLELQDEKTAKSSAEGSEINAEIEVKSSCPFAVKRVARDMVRTATGTQYDSSLVSVGADGEMIYDGSDFVTLTNWQGDTDKAYRLIKVSTESTEQVERVS